MAIDTNPTTARESIAPADPVWVTHCWCSRSEKCQTIAATVISTMQASRPNRIQSLRLRCQDGRRSNAHNTMPSMPR
ncbi:hypothetical protein [Cryptosporangium japonicum]|uniref:hypothetical protein n=1 Tax=Cryptosporangium japonicum TaxID=80872 RepID=UPI0031D2EB2E